nr:hypothetical protein [Tanacetum cinerariifolium]
MGCEDAFKTRLVVYKFEGNALAWWKAYKQTKGGDECLKREYHSIRQMNTETSTEFMQHFLRLAGFLGAAAGTAEEQAKNFQWGLRRSTLNHLMCMPFTDVAQVANNARNYEILYERDDNDAERPDKQNFGTGRDQRNRGQQSNRSVSSGFQQSKGPSEGYSYQFALRVDADTQESVVELLVPASSVVKLAIYRRIARRTPLRVHLV